MTPGIDALSSFCRATTLTELIIVYQIRISSIS